MNLYSKRKGITLMEMLVVIVLITLLSAVIVPSSVEVVSTAEANKIINNLYALRTAVLMWRKENAALIQPGTKEAEKAGQLYIKGAYKIFQEANENDALHVLQYLDAGNGMKLNTNGGKAMSEGTYGVFDGGEKNYGYNRNSWFVGYRFNSLERNGSVRDSLRKQGRARKVFLGGDSPNATYNVGTESSAWMQVCGPWNWEATRK